MYLSSQEIVISGIRMLINHADHLMMLFVHDDFRGNHHKHVTIILDNDDFFNESVIT